MSKKERIIDFHSHILPCADHGSDGMKMSAEQVALMNNAGVDTVVLTPHFYPNCHTVAQFTADISAAAEELVSCCEKRPRFCIGAEVLYCEGIEGMERLDGLCVRGTNVLLLELPMSEWSKGILYEVKRLAQRYTVVLAHIDRYIERQEKEISYLLANGALAQMNSSALYRRGTRRALKPFIAGGQISALGSDLHESNKRIYAQFSKADKKLGDEYEKIMTRAAELLVSAELI